MKLKDNYTTTDILHEKSQRNSFGNPISQLEKTKSNSHPEMKIKFSSPKFRILEKYVIPGQLGLWCGCLEP